MDSATSATVNSDEVRVLAFTCTRYRPLMARHCVMQMQRQTYKADHVVYLNASEDDPPDQTVVDYRTFLEDAREPNGGKLIIGSGKSQPYQGNYLACLGLINLDDYDLFLKIDDDDIYYRRYVEEVVADFQRRKWDYSGTHSEGVLMGKAWQPGWKLQDLGFEFQDLELRVPLVMPPTLAMSRKAMDVILDLDDTGQIEDIQWRRVVARASHLVMAERSDRNFVYNVHGGNVSTGSWLKQ